MKLLITEEQLLILEEVSTITYRNTFDPQFGDKLIKGARYRMLMDGKDVGGFGIGLIGDIPLDPDKYFPNLDTNKTFPNSIYFTGGFSVNYERHKQGIGTKIIHLIFQKNPTIKNIFLYALDWQGAIPFWEKLGGKIILEEPNRSIKYIQLNRKNLR